MGILDSGYYVPYEQDAFGNRIPGSTTWEDMTSPGPKEHLTGKMFDTTTNLYYFHARWYDPEVGRFVSKDKLGGCSEGSNLYIFVEQDPTNSYDPDGNLKVVSGGKGKCGCPQKMVDDLLNAGKVACNKLHTHVKPRDKKLYKCLLEQCVNGTVTCRQDCDTRYGADTCGGTLVPKNTNPPIGTKRPSLEIAVCPNLTSNGGQTVIHEFGHKCGCTHKRNGKVDDYLKGNGCDMLPRGCGGKSRGF